MAETTDLVPGFGKTGPGPTSGITLGLCESQPCPAWPSSVTERGKEKEKGQKEGEKKGRKRGGGERERQEREGRGLGGKRKEGESN